MESIFFVFNYIVDFSTEIGKKICIKFSKLFYSLINRLKIRTVITEDSDELSDAEYNRRFGKFFPKDEECEEIRSSSGYYSSRAEASAHGAILGASEGGMGFYH